MGVGVGPILVCGLFITDIEPIKRRYGYLVLGRIPDDMYNLYSCMMKQ